MGVRLSIDDFGTGFSSLSYLKRLPIDTIKIDKSFVRDIKTDANDAAIITAIIKMSHSLNFKVIAEGVETADQLNYLKQYECDEIQGFYFSKPLSAVDFEKLLRSERMLDIFQPVII
jgi:EAL domain-containing protein (putative c-di-GMP-specific phosphodiesterase class I)